MTAAPSAALSTPRLRLRPPGPGDASSIFAAYGGDAEVARFLTWRTHRSVADAQAFVDASLRGWRDGSDTAYLAWMGDGLVGSTGLTRVDDGWARLGYAVACPRWGQGLAGEMVQAMVLEAARRGQHVEALVEPGHVRSVRVLEKAGFRPAGTARTVHPNLGPEQRTVLRYVRHQD